MGFTSRLTVLLLFVGLSKSTRVRERFSDETLNSQIRIAIPGTKTFSTNPVQEAFMLSLVEGICRGLNYTILEYQMESNGYPDENGTYDGFNGYMQRGEADVGFNFVRPDSSPHEPVRFTPPIIAADAAIITSRNAPRNVPVDITDVVKNMEPEAYAYFFISLFLVSILTTASLLLTTKVSPIKAWSDYYETLCLVLSTILNQENSSWGRWSARIVWSTFSFAVLIFIIGYFLNLMSVDQCAELKAPVIDSLFDILYDTQFNYITPAIIKIMYLYSILERSPNNTDAARLYNRLLKNKEQSIIDVDMKNIDKIETIIEEGSPVMNAVTGVMNGTMGLIVIREFCDRFEVIVTKALGADKLNGRTPYISKESLFGGITTALVSKFLGIEGRALIDYRVRNWIEMDGFKTYIDLRAGELAEVCLTCERSRNVADNIEKKRILPPSAMPLEGIARLSIVVALGFAIASIVILGEWVASRIALRMQERKRQRRVMFWKISAVAALQIVEVTKKRRLRTFKASGRMMIIVNRF